MKTALCLFLFACVLSCAPAVPTAAPTAKATEPRAAKPTLYVVGSPGCVWCRRLEQGTLPKCQKELARFRVVQTEDRATAERFGVTSFPTLVVVGSDGTELARHVGYMDAATFCDWLETIP
jgi:thioredoxin-related protein